MIGQSVAHHQITGKLGAGGMGEVYRTDTRLNRQVALKVLPQVFAQDERRMGPFEREAQVLASLNHQGPGKGSRASLPCHSHERHGESTHPYRHGWADLFPRLASRHSLRVRPGCDTAIIAPQAAAFTNQDCMKGTIQNA